MAVDADRQLLPPLHFTCKEAVKYKRKVTFDNRQFFINYLIPPPPSFIFEEAVEVAPDNQCARVT